MGTSNSPYIMTLVNSIIGVSILAMPFCYKQCGIVLASFILLFSNLMTRLSCHYLLKSAIIARRRTFEMLAFHALGSYGKIAIELSIILLMLGTCIAFFVVMGDLGPAIIGSQLGLEYSAALRPTVLIGIAVCVVLPLGLLRNVDSLSSICTASFFFYLLLVMKVFMESTDNLFLSHWIVEVHYWRPAGLLQCLPIFSMALSCQTQLLEIFDSVHNGTLSRMNSIVKSTLNLCTSLYMAVGFLGYIAYYRQPFSGNLLMSFRATRFSEFIKIGFILSVAVTFPMVIFPCRTSLYSLLFKKLHMPHYELVTGGKNHIPELQFKCITFFIVTSSLVVGLLTPNIETVLGLLGSTIGVIICIVSPPFIFICISGKATTEKILAQVMFAFGVFIMVMSTYANLYLNDSSSHVDIQNKKNVDDVVQTINEPVKSLIQKDIVNTEKDRLAISQNENKMNIIPESNAKILALHALDKIPEPEEKIENKRIEPPIPNDPEIADVPQKDEKQAGLIVDDTNKSRNNKELANNKINNVSGSSETLPKFKDEQRLLQDNEDVFNQNGNISMNERKINKSSEKLNVDNTNISEKLPKVLNKQASESLHLNDARKQAMEQPPLPLLIKAQNGANAKVKSDNVVQKESSQNQAKLPKREKRDLYHVTNVFINGKEKPGVNKADEERLISVKEIESNSFAINVAKGVNSNSVCEKYEAEPIPEKNNVPVISLKLEKFDEINKNSSLAKNVTNLLKETLMESQELLNVEKVSSSVIEIQKDEKISELKEKLILTPSRLSDPAFLLRDNLYVDDKNPVVVNKISGHLKNVDKQSESGEK